MMSMSMSIENPTSRTMEWPDPQLRPSELWRGYQEGDYSGAEKLANDLRQKFTSDVVPRAMLLTVCSERNWSVTMRRMGYRYDGQLSTLRSLIVPMQTGGFSIVVNSDHTYGQQTEKVETALIAHEVCHGVVFFNKDIPPKRRVRHLGAEEVFCDTFAESLTGIELNKAIDELSVPGVVRN